MEPVQFTISKSRNAMIVKEESDQESAEMKYLIYQLKVTISLKSRNSVWRIQNKQTGGEVEE